jgi:hypothetical protein
VAIDTSVDFTKAITSLPTLEVQLAHRAGGDH